MKEIYKNFKSELQEFEKLTEWKTAALSTMEIVDIKDVLNLKFATTNFDENVQVYPINNSAFLTLQARAEISGNSLIKLLEDKRPQYPEKFIEEYEKSELEKIELKKLKLKQEKMPYNEIYNYGRREKRQLSNRIKEMKQPLYSHILNECFKCDKKKESSIINIYNNQVYACHSESYRVLSPLDLYDTFEQTAKLMFENIELLKYSIEPTFICAYYRIIDDNVVKKYKKALPEGWEDDYLPVVKVITSNTGFSGANLYPQLCSKTGAPIATSLPIVQEHKGNCNLEKYTEKVKQCFSLVYEGAENIERLSKIEVNYPEHFAANICAYCKLPQKKFMPIIWQIADEYKDESSNVAQIYLYLCEMLDNNTPEVDKLRISDCLSRILTIKDESFKQFDKTNKKINQFTLF